MRRDTKFLEADSIPLAQLAQLPFGTYRTSSASPMSYESSIWELAVILFDEPDVRAYNIRSSEADKYEARIRKDQLRKFWTRLCQEDSQKAADESSSHEERAIAYLSAYLKEEACDALSKGGNHRLATLVAQVGGNTSVQDIISSQLSAWRDLNVLSEMSEPIRAIYSLVAGQTCLCEGKKAQHIEDKARTFAISERFKLDWRRAFGLRLFYGLKANEPLETAITAFMEDMECEEPARPEGDALYTLLRLYAAAKSSQTLPDLRDILLPQRGFLSAIGPRLSFQLFLALRSWFPSLGDPDAADTAIKTFAVQLDSAGEWLWAVFVVLHITRASARDQSLRAILCHHAKDVTADPPFKSSEAWQVLTDEFKIPATWIWQAKASYARLAEGDRVREATYLIRGSQEKQAHEVLQRFVGPQCVIGEEWSQLQGLLEAFKSCKDRIVGWSLGGQIYSDYLQLLLGRDEAKNKGSALKGLLSSLKGLLDDTEQQARGRDEVDRELFLQSVALQEMIRTVSDDILALREKVR